MPPKNVPHDRKLNFAPRQKIFLTDVNICYYVGVYLEIGNFLSWGTFFGGMHW